MDIKPCQLSKKEQLKLMEFFVAGTTARTAAEWVGICLVPNFCCIILEQDYEVWKEALGDRFTTGTPERRRQFVSKFLKVKRA
ncbi:hypothetical protein AGMMS49949_02300 [Alphaproteobacteria bacterium]|nr:hypothetical protein AGMMS49949_02300 [Alphaproteobacteria bacterium]